MDARLPTSHNPTATWLSWFARIVVAAAFFLILVGSHTTTVGAGMAFPDWPLSHGSVNPAGWWENFMQSLEHGHRLTAEFVGLLIGVLAAWVWQSKWSVPAALLGSILVALIARGLGAAPSTVAHVGLWSSAIIFTAMLLLWRGDASFERPPADRWIAFAAFLGVLAQAIMGGFRVTIEAGGDVQTATVIRILHGCFAQIELGLLVVLAVRLSPVWQKILPNVELRNVARLAWCVVGLVFLQLMVGATMRHLGAGLAIPTFPAAAPSGSWLPEVHSWFVELNFAHTRIGALLVTVGIITLRVLVVRRAAGNVAISRPAILLDVLLALQLTLGILVILKMRPPLLTTLHVVNGAALLSNALLMAVRTSRAASLMNSERIRPSGVPVEVPA